MTFGEQTSEKEAYEILSYAFDQGINILDTAEAVRSSPFVVPPVCLCGYGFTVEGSLTFKNLFTYVICLGICCV